MERYQPPGGRDFGPRVMDDVPLLQGDLVTTSGVDCVKLIQTASVLP